MLEIVQMQPWKYNLYKSLKYLKVVMKTTLNVNPWPEC